MTRPAACQSECMSSITVIHDLTALFCTYGMQVIVLLLFSMRGLVEDNGWSNDKSYTRNQMSILLNNSEKRKRLLKHMIKQLHSGEAPEQINKRLAALLQKIPYGEVVEVEQELIAEGLPEEEVIKLCDIHSKALEGNIDHTGAKTAPPGQPVDTFLKENEALLNTIDEIETIFIDPESCCYPVPSPVQRSCR